MKTLLLPGDPLFYETLARPPKMPVTHGTSFICRVGSYVLEPVGERELDDYLEGGEYDQRMDEWEETETSSLTSEVLYLPESMRLSHAVA
jgi:hypothetical protein